MKKLLEDNGWMLVHITGSHHKFKKAGGGTIVVPVQHGLVKHGYYKKAKLVCGVE